MRGHDHTPLARLLGPSHIVIPRLVAGRLLDDTLEERPEAYSLHWIVEPAGGDTKVGLMRRHVVDAMVLARQDDV